MNVLGRSVSTVCRSANLNSFLSRPSSYKSAISLETLYPNSSLKLSTPAEPSYSEGKSWNGYIPLNQLNITYSRSSGPGGQNVNKVNTKVDLRFHLQSATWISEDIKQKLAEQMKTKLTMDGYLVFRSDLTRFQHLNMAACLDRLRTAIFRAIADEPVQPKPEFAEKIRRRLERASAERLLVKRQRSQIKRDRQAPVIDV